VPGDVESDFFMLKLVANSGSMHGEDSKGRGTLYKYLIRQTSQPASVIQTNSKKKKHLWPSGVTSEVAYNLPCEVTNSHNDTVIGTL
jgi:hypothetical protein